MCLCLTNDFKWVVVVTIKTKKQCSRSQVLLCIRVFSGVDHKLRTNPVKVKYCPHKGGGVDHKLRNNEVKVKHCHAQVNIYNSI